MVPIRVVPAFDAPEEILMLVRCNGPYRSIASNLPPSATTSARDESDAGTTAAWFRGNWVVAGEARVPGAEAILDNARFADAAARLFGVEYVTPSTVVVNVNAPMPAGAVHVDIPSFRGANRDRYPLQLLQAMGASGLFEDWRINEAGAVTWFYDGVGGAYDYWPDGLDGPMHSEQPPYFNTALVADNDRMYHRIGAVGDEGRRGALYPASAHIAHLGDGWAVACGDRVLDTFADADVRISILWKAQIPLAEPAEALTTEQIVSVLGSDLRRRRTAAAEPLTEEWINLIHRTYYPTLPD